ncbi:MAG: bifunctional folylpolyglutamate synthase/dihydrofolate synthase [Sphingobacteriaceae bacterium]
MAFSTYADTLNYLYAQLPMFTRVGATAYKADLSNTLALCEALNHPEHAFKSVHIGGTNGKGSSSHMLAAILQTAGYKTGLYTSPHLRDFRERIRINGQMMPEQEVIDFVNTHQALFESIKPSFFESTVAMAFDYFAKQKVDLAIIEVGLGGRLDSTNVIHPLLSLITNISLDHQDLLGSTLGEISTEKAGIIKPHTPIIIGEKQTETAAIFTQKAVEKEAKLVFAQTCWKVHQIESAAYLTVQAESKNSSLELILDLTGTYQLKNLPGVLSAVDELRSQGFKITEEHVKTALKQVTSLTGLQGRWQTLKHTPLVICDTGHNEDGVREVLKNISLTPHQNLHLVWGMVKDKDSAKILSLLPKTAHYYFCQPNIPRGKDAGELAQEAQTFGLKGETHASVAEAYQQALSHAKPNDLVFVGGSTFVVAEVI